MANVEFVLDSDIPAATVMAAVADFSDRRTTLWPTIDPTLYRVHALGDTWADVTEGSRFLGTIWARERYDWSTHGTICATVIDSNVFRAGGTWVLEVSELEGRTRIHVRSRRQARGVRGHILGAILTLAGRTTLAGNLDCTLRLLTDDREITGAAAR